MDWSTVEEWSNWPYDPYYPHCEEKNAPPAPAQHAPAQAQPYVPDETFTLLFAPPDPMPPPDMPPKGDNPREIRNKAEKQRRDKMKKSISELAKIVPPVVATGRKMDKTSVLNLTAHYLRAHQYVFGDSINSEHRFSSGSAQALLGLLKGFVLTTTYKGIVVVVSQNVQQYLGYTELELIGKSIFEYTHADDREMLREQLMPTGNVLGTNGELLIPDGPDGTEKVAEALAREKRRFVVRFKKVSQRSDSTQYVTCHVQGTLRKADMASRNSSRCCQMVRRVRARGDNARPCGNDVVFVGLVRPTSETFMSESSLESFRMEYRTRHSIDGEIIECESRIALVTGYMTHEVNGVNAMNFMHRDDVRWVIIALREMYDQHRLVGESCYRLMTKNGKFIYMQTRGFLDVDRDSRAVTSFVCTNTVVEENVGKRLIKLMKKKFTLLVNNGEDTDIPDDNEDDDTKELSDDQLSPIPVEDPRQLQKVILHLVTNLPSPQPPDSDFGNCPSQEDSFPQRLAIIPPRKERIVSAIEKIYSVIKPFNKVPILVMDGKKEEQDKMKGNTTPFDIATGNSETETASITPPASSRHAVGTMRDYTRYGGVRLRSQSRSELLLQTRTSRVMPVNQVPPIVLPSTTRIRARSTHLDRYDSGVMNFSFETPQRSSEAEGRQLVSPLFQTSNNAGFADSISPPQPSIYSDTSMAIRQRPLNSLHVSSYVNYSAVQFPIVPAPNRTPGHDINYRRHLNIPHTVATASGTKRQNESPPQQRGDIKKKPDFALPELTYPTVGVVRPMRVESLRATATVTPPIEIGTVAPEIETPVITSYATATVSTAGAALSMARVEESIPLFVAQEANSSSEDDDEGSEVSAEMTFDEQENSSKIEIEDSTLGKNCLLTSNRSLEEDSLQENLGDFPDINLPDDQLVERKNDSLDKGQRSLELVTPHSSQQLISPLSIRIVDIPLSPATAAETLPVQIERVVTCCVSLFADISEKNRFSWDGDESGESTKQAINNVDEEPEGSRITHYEDISDESSDQIINVDDEPDQRPLRNFVFNFKPSSEENIELAVIDDEYNETEKDCYVISDSDSDDELENNLVIDEDSDEEIVVT